jgi:hypothetical protein
VAEGDLSAESSVSATVSRQNVVGGYFEVIVSRLATVVARSTVLAVAVGVLVGCGPSAGSYRKNAEKFIVSEKFLEQAAGQVTSRLTSVNCAEPISAEVGSTFGCSASDDAGVQYQIAVRISGASEMEFEVERA